MTLSINGYHGTKESHLTSIRQDGFVPSENPKHWLGGGVYFYQDDYEEALGWAKEICKNSRHKPVVLYVVVSVEDKFFANLDSRYEQMMFADFVKEIVDDSENNEDNEDTGKRIKFGNDPYINGCLLYDAYSIAKDKHVLKKTFVGSPLRNIAIVKQKLAINIDRTSTQICVKKDYSKHISIEKEYCDCRTGQYIDYNRKKNFLFYEK